MSEPTLSQLLETAVAAAKAAGAHALNNKHRRTESAETFAHDIKLVLDMECQKVTESVIGERFPDHSILGEEDSRTAANDAYEWVIDPIDGTMNFSYGFPYWCSSVAVRHNGKVVAGCVYAPEFDDCFSAHIEGPAERNGAPIHVSDTRELKDALIFTGLYKAFEADAETHFSLFKKLAFSTKKLRISGAAALDFCHVAAGSSDGFFEKGIYPWDFSAGGLIIERAGGAVDFRPQGDGTYAALGTNPHLIGKLQELLAP